MRRDGRRDHVAGLQDIGRTSMREATNIIKDINDQVCGSGGLISSICKESTTAEGKNYVVILLFAFFIQYGLPLLSMFMLIPILGLNILAFFNPLSVFTAPAVIVFDVGLILIILIASLVVTVFYWVFYFRMIGVLALVPVLMSIISFFIGFVPVIGNVMSSVINIIPWMAIMIVIHWATYSGKIEALIVPLK